MARFRPQPFRSILPVLAAGALAGLGLAGAAGSAQAADLTLQLQAVRADDGHVMVALFDAADSFLKRPLMAQQVAAARRAPDGSLRLVFAGLAPGRYALTAYHDRNGNGKLDTNLMGLPTEPYGFSNAAKANFGPPTFDEAAVTVAEPGGRAELVLD